MALPADSISLVGLTSLTNPYAIMFYGGVMLPAASLQDGRCSLLVACMAATALTIYGAFAFIFSHARVRPRAGPQPAACGRGDGRLPRPVRRQATRRSALGTLPGLLSCRAETCET